MRFATVWFHKIGSCRLRSARPARNCFMEVVCFAGSRVVIRVVVRYVGKIFIISRLKERRKGTEGGLKESKKEGMDVCVSVSYISDGTDDDDLLTFFSPLFTLYP